MSFYVTLPSNSSMQLYPKNTATNFTTQLKIPIRMEMSYEVALVELNYNHSWHYYLGEIIFFHRGIDHHFELSSIEGDKFSEFIDKINELLAKEYIAVEIVHASNNRTIDDREKLIENLKERFDFPKLTFENNRLRFNCPINSYFQFHGPIAGLLDLKEYDKVYLNHIPIPIRENIFSIIQTIFVYTDIIDYQLVGDSYSQLLQTVITTDKNYASIVSTKFDNPHYVPVNKSMITSINIDLRDDLGNKILFQNGKTIAKLHFRPKRYGL
jgi:hypothetical protein